MRQLVQSEHETYVEVDEEKFPELVQEFILSGYDDWDGKTPIVTQQAELDFQAYLGTLELGLHSQEYREILSRKDPLVPNAGVCRISIHPYTGLKVASAEPDSFQNELDQRRIKRPTL